MSKCVCGVWIDRLWKDEDYVSKKRYPKMEMQVSFTCPEHGEISLDNRENPVPHVDARDPVKEYQASRMRKRNILREQEQQEQNDDNIKVSF